MTSSSTTDRPDTPHVLAPPPAIFLGALGLERRFGEEYRRFCGRVRRWL